MGRIGLIAGGGKLPIIFAKRAKEKNVKVIGFAIKEMALPELSKACDRMHWLSIDQIKKFLFLVFIERIKKIVLLGKVDKAVIYKLIKGNREAASYLKNFEDKSDYTILKRVTEEFQKRGIEVIDGLEFLSDLLPSKGVLTKRKPTEREFEDIMFGMKIAKEITKLDISQTVVIKDKAVVGVEGMEGTNETIERSAKLCGRDFVVVKVARPGQDMRFDVPTVGPETITTIANYGGKVLAIEQNLMFVVDKDRCISIADESDISIVVT